MRNLSILAFTSFLILWGISSYLKGLHAPTNRSATKQVEHEEIASKDALKPSKAINKISMLARANKKELDRIGEVINADNVEIDNTTKEKIQVAKKEFDVKTDLRGRERILEQSFADPNSSLADIKTIQNKIVDEKNKLKLEVKNTEKWEPRFVYYLLMNENYSYAEINQIQSLSENGFNTDELEYINELVKTKAFGQRIAEYKGQNEQTRRVASTAKDRERDMRDEYVEGSIADAPSLEEKMIEMNYSQQLKGQKN